MSEQIIKGDTKMSYEVGDKVRIVDHWNDDCCQNFDGYMDKWLGKVMTIASKTSWGSYIMKEDNGQWSWNDYTITGLAEDFEEKIVITHNKKDTIARYYKGGKCVRKAAAHCHKDDDFDFNEGARRAFNRLVDMIDLGPKVNAAAPQFQIGDRVEYHYKDASDYLFCRLKEGEAGTILSIKVDSDWVLYLVKFDDSYYQTGLWIDEKLLKKRPKYYTAKIVCVDNHHLPHWQVGKIYHVTDGQLENDDVPSSKNKRYMSLKEINDTHFAQFIEVVD